MRTTKKPARFKVKAWGKLPRFAFIGAKMRAFLAPQDTGDMSCYHIVLPGRGTIPPAYHRKAVELIWIIKGGGVAKMGPRSVRLKRGDSLLIRPTTPHGFTAGSSGMTFLAVLSPRVDSRTDYYACSGSHHAPPRALSGRLVEGREAAGRGRMN
ncbi:MAG TPA: cupin domain-containing protein [Elusimicrobiota bacterium]|jgi:mannose-6-phosphate isomerase-like protein (cupin superfamily)|nr:cupin domain-containing protein [Elusimicrobiota bacterium]